MHAPQRERAEFAWRRVEAIVARDDVIGRGGSSVVYRGSLDELDPDEPLVAVKVRAPYVSLYNNNNNNIDNKSLQLNDGVYYKLLCIRLDDRVRALLYDK